MSDIIEPEAVSVAPVGPDLTKADLYIFYDPVTQGTSIHFDNEKCKNWHTILERLESAKRLAEFNLRMMERNAVMQAQQMAMQQAQAAQQQLAVREAILKPHRGVA